MADLRERAAAVGIEIRELRRRAVLANDVQTLAAVKEADRVFAREFGDQDPGDCSVLKLYRAERKIARLAENVRREVEAEHAEANAGLDAYADELAEREEAVAERERQASPSYRARFFAAGALLALSADALIRVVA